VNEDQVPEILLTGFAVVRDHDESIGKEEEVRNTKEDDDESADEEEDYFTSERVFF
jgi:hypothetical protein